MRALAELCEAVSRTTKKTEKVALVANYFTDHPADEAGIAALFLSGKPFPAHEETILNVGGALLSRVLIELSRASEAALHTAYRRHGDLGAAAEDLLQRSWPDTAPLTLAAVEACFGQIAQTSKQQAKAELLRNLLKQATPVEAKYLIKIIGGDLRIGLRESLVEEAIAKAYSEPYADVRRANMLLGDIGETLRYAAEHRLQEARMRMFHPIGMMLASPVENAAEAISYFTNAAVEDKYDGIRAQAHCAGGIARVFSRTLDEVTSSFPDIAASLARIPGPVIFDGEVVAWKPDDTGGRALPFSDLQQRIGRKGVTQELLQAVPVAYVAFDVLYADGALTIDRPLRERGILLDRILSEIANPETGFALGAAKQKQHDLFFTEEKSSILLPPIIRAPVRTAHDSAALDRLFEEAQARGNEGLMIKDVESPYAPGRRGKSWLKLKRELATLDVVVTAAEWGHGKRAGVLSDVTFAVRSGDELLNVGKAYSGLTDAEIAELTRWFLEHTIVDHGYIREVEPKVVLEVAFNNVMESDRHASGYALRFPRILRIRTDKFVEEIDTVERVREIYEQQSKTAA